MTVRRNFGQQFVYLFVPQLQRGFKFWIKVPCTNIKVLQFECFYFNFDFAFIHCFQWVWGNRWVLFNNLGVTRFIGVRAWNLLHTNSGDIWLSGATPPPPPISFPRVQVLEGVEYSIARFWEHLFVLHLLSAYRFICFILHSMKCQLLLFPKFLKVYLKPHIKT